MQRTSRSLLRNAVLLGVVVFVGYFVFLTFYPPFNVGLVDRKIVSEIRKRCIQGQPCVLRIQSVIQDFDWDTMYVFEMGASRSDIESVIHTPLSHSPDLVKTLIFMKQGRITHYEEESEDIENATDQDLNFNIEQSGGHKQFSKDVAFSVSIKKFDKAIVYGLTSVP
jgi:hypothetical protein